MSKPTVLLAAVVVGLAVAVPAVLAGTSQGAAPVDHQSFDFRSGAISTRHRVWADVPGLKGVLVCARNAVSATLSVDLSGAPARFRVQVDDGGTLSPPTAQFGAGGGTTSFSFTFVGNLSTFEGSDIHALDVQWRSPTGRQVTLRTGGVNLLFERGQRSC